MRVMRAVSTLEPGKQDSFASIPNPTMTIFSPWSPHPGCWMSSIGCRSLREAKIRRASFHPTTPEKSVSSGFSGQALVACR